MRRKNYLLVVLTLITISSSAQDKWDLRRCIDYALANNISIKQTDIQARLAKLQAYQNKMGQFPSLSFSGNTSYNSGRSQDPTTYSLSTQSYLAANMQLQTSVEIFNWYSKRNTISASMWELQAALANSEKLRNDIALTVANVYLQVLLSREQEKIATIQLQQSQSQLEATRKRVNAGALPELNAAELEAQLARDSSSYITAKGNTQQNLLSLKAYMALDAATPFEVDIPPVEKIPVDDIASLLPDVVYASAIANLPQQRYNDYKIKAAEKSTAAARGNMYPTISLFGSLGSGYANYFNVINYKKEFKPIGLETFVNGTFYDVYGVASSNIPDGKIKSDAFFTQLNRNFRQAVGLNLSVPIFNGSNLRTTYDRSKLNLENLQLQQQLDNQKLKQDIYTAYNAAMVALEKFNAGKKTVEAAEKTLAFAQKRYDVGMLGTFELITNQNNLFSARLNYAVNQYDYVFKMKVLEFYKGLGIKL
ncbi:MAG: TolC family protein [Ferruginibacter sp.]